MNKTNSLRAIEAFSRAFGMNPMRANNAQAWGGLSVCEWKLPWREGFELAENDDLIVAYHSAGSRRVRAACDGLWINKNSAPGLFSVIPPGRHVTYRIDGAVSFSSLHIPREAIGGISGSRGTVPQNIVFAFQNGFADACMQTLLNEMRAGGARDLLYINAVTRALVLNLMRSFPQEPAVPQGSGIPLTPVLDYIEEHIAAPLTLDDLARQAGVSRAHFARHFRSVTGMSPHQYIILRRTERAKDLLRNPRLGMVWIAREVGFGSQSHFTQVFHAVTGQTPRKFRLEKAASAGCTTHRTPAGNSRKPN